MGMPGEKHLRSGDGRAGATAPTTTAMDAAGKVLFGAFTGPAHGKWDDLTEGDKWTWRKRASLVLAAWIDGLTDEQLESAAWECPKLVRAALTRLGGAHE